MNKRKLIAIDNGKKNLKAKCDKEELIYNNNYSLGFTHDGSLLGNNTFNVSYKNVQYTIGNNARTSDKNEGKGSDVQIVQALTAITRFLKPNVNEKVCVLYGESVDKYFDIAHKEEIKSALEGRHILTVGNLEEELTYVFTVEEVHILPEGTGELLSDFVNKFEGTHYVVDIGGGTINFLTTSGLRPEPQQSRSFPLGINNVVAKIIRNAKRIGINADGQDKLIYEYLNGDKPCLNQNLAKVMEDAVIDQLKEFDDRLSGLGVNLHDILQFQPVTFIGGGSGLFKKYIDKHYKCEVQTTSLVVENPVMSNVRGFYNYGLIKNL